MMHVPAGRPYLIPPAAGTAVDVMREAGTTVVAPAGMLDASTRSAFDRAMESATLENAGIIIDLRRCLNCDSSSIIKMLQYKRALGERLQIVVPESGPVRRTLEVSGLTRRLAVTTTLERARELLFVNL
jgi:anti-anti-sigma factor